MWIQGLPGAQYPLRVKEHKMHEASSSAGGTVEHGLEVSASADQVSWQLEAVC